MRKKKIVILISGRGSNMEAIIRNSKEGILQDCADVVLVVSNREDAKGIEVAKKFGVETRVVKSAKREREAFEKELIGVIDQYMPDYVVLAGFMRVLTPLFINHFKDRIINIHPADTSLYQGSSGYEWAFENHLESTDITVHFVNEGVDTGTVLAKKNVDLKGALSLQDIKKRGLDVEHIFYSEVLYDVCSRQ